MRGEGPVVFERKKKIDSDTVDHESCDDSKRQPLAMAIFPKYNGPRFVNPFLPPNNRQQECVFEECHNCGIPDPEFDFFVCDRCLERMAERLMMNVMREITRINRHLIN